MYSYTWYQWLTFFYFYCFFGWIFESTYVSLKKKRLVNRGFLRLPMLPIYGTGAVMMLWVSIPVRDSLCLTWLFGAIGATVLEYVTGAAMEHLFKVRYWDYSNQKFNLHGHICLSSSIAWGFLTIFMTWVLHKPVEHAILAMPFTWNMFFVIFMTIIFVYDAVICTREAFAFGKSLEALEKLRQELDGLQVQRALLKMEAEEYLEETKEELRERLEERYEQLPEQAKLQIAELREQITDAKTQLTAIRSKTERLLIEQEEKISALQEKRSRFLHHLTRSNPSATSKRFNQEFKQMQDYIRNNIRKPKE